MRTELEYLLDDEDDLQWAIERLDALITGAESYKTDIRISCKGCETVVDTDLMGIDIIEVLNDRLCVLRKERVRLLRKIQLLEDAEKE